MSSNSRPQVPVASGLIEERIIKIVSWLLCGLAMLTVVLKTIIRIHTHGRLKIDDGLLVFAAICLLAATIFIYTSRYSRVFEYATILVYPPRTDRLMNVEELNDGVHTVIISYYVLLSLIWTAIYASKFAYLWFFKQLILRIRPLMMFWWGVFVLTVISYILTIISGFIVCPWSDMRAATCSVGSRFLAAFRIALATLVLDVVTDALIVSLAIMILVKVKIKVSQKFGLALFLCLSAMLAAIAITRTTHFSIKTYFGTDTINLVWNYFWLQTEACLAVCFVSLTAFRSFFVLRDRKRIETQDKRGWYGSAAKFMKGKSRTTIEHDRLPSIPSATMTGLNSFLQHEGRGTDYSSDETFPNEKAIDEVTPNQSQIMVTKTFHTEVYQVDDHRHHVGIAY